MTGKESFINFIQDLIPRSFIVLLYCSTTVQTFKLKLDGWDRNEHFLPVETEETRYYKYEIMDKNHGTVDLLLHTSRAKRATHYGLQGCAPNVVPVTSEAFAKKHTSRKMKWWPVFIWICLCYRQGLGVLLPTRPRALDKWATLNAVACGEKKYFSLGHLQVHYPSDIDQRMGGFLVDCVGVLRQNAECRSARLDHPPVQGATDQSTDEEPEDIDGVLHVFTTTTSWVKLTELSNPSQ
ncbi:hypothetical protein DEU56DRAFT_821297 [Suillus clintonianus]|uniref:uncharacterized protein n=1 Tax=Suillus clintonianus TaxID=1904413 RepID=UPI001B865464|nr:uncharacterized protein DEU56DRAFT_821297 [Suillus clintonianus]KAG2127124.1 hypothetical protein DEU56DRAFT_821297 [Suillus clintonianus]